MSDSTRVFININDSLSQKELSEIKNIILSQNPDHHTIFGISGYYWTNIIIPICLPVAAFFLALWVSNLISKRKLLKDLKMKQTFLFTWVDLIKNQILSQSESLKKYAAQLKEMKIDEEGLGKLNIHIEKLQVIDAPTIVSIFVTNKTGDQDVKSRLLFDFENHVEFIRRKHDSTDALLESLKQVLSETTDKWNERFEHLETIIQSLHTNMKTSSEENVFIKQILAIYSAYSNSGEKGMKPLVEKFIKQAGPMSSDYLNTNPDPKIFELISCMKMLRHIYESKNYHFNAVAKLFDEAAEEITEKYYLLVATKNELAKIKFKSALSMG